MFNNDYPPGPPLTEEDNNILLLKARELGENLAKWREEFIADIIKAHINGGTKS